MSCGAILAIRCTPKPDEKGPSWLTVLGHTRDSLGSVDLFGCEFIVLRSYNAARCHVSLDGHTRLTFANRRKLPPTYLNDHTVGLPIAGISCSSQRPPTANSRRTG